MSEVVGEGVIELTVDDKGVVNGVKGVEGKIGAAGSSAGKKFGSGFGGAVKGLLGAAAITGAVAGAVGLVKSSLGEAREAQKVGAQTVATLKATGGAANVTAKEVSDLAGALSEKTGVDDEAIQSGANLLLTFKNVANEAGKGNKIFNEATAAAGDLAAAGFGSIESASVMLGKALNDPIKGVSALSRVGVGFTEQQKEQIKTLQESGDVLGAQKIILGEVKGQVGGVAEATATAGDKAKVTWGNMQEQIGTALLPVLDNLAAFFTDTLGPAISDLITWISDFAAKPEVQEFGADLVAGGEAVVAIIRDEVIPILGDLGTAILDTIGFFKEHEGAATALGILLGAVFAGIAAAYVLMAVQSTINTIIVATNWLVVAATGELAGVAQQKTVAQMIVGWVLMGIGATINAVKIVAAWILSFVTTAATAVASFLTSVAVIVGGWVLMGVQAMMAALRIAAAWLISLGPIGLVIIAIGLVIGVIALLWAKSETFRTVVIGVWNGIKAAVSAVVDWFRGPFAAFFTTTLPGFFTDAWNRVKTTVSTGAAAVLATIKEVPGKIGGALGNLGSTLSGFFEKAWTAAKTAVTSGITTVIGLIREVPGKIAAFAGDMLAAGKNIGGSVLDGIRAGLSAAGGVVTDIVSAIRNGINSALGLPKSLTFGKGKFSFTFTLPAFADGTNSAPGGLALVGEDGPELVNLRRGSSVTPADETAALLRQRPGATINVYSPAADASVVAMQVLNRLAVS